ncbi:uncharacterized protein K452DRAFT_32201 [Aplosporella prunicola CBS 121167]|uniref:Uncharacterized protein n=1 Tax=Aplosporella prunicola CBS 121167 TaxID=1176127 RepID=A0A6A6BGL9_9PEZI|nr:uncharacterized protein K452DRAFT_32201 [Aplosporella prunicola CBS 121167]KAF2141681.1 hypothetical protein K452DRAFT_32201 [Aplosporella prunicola CBS 121167]
MPKADRTNPDTEHANSSQQSVHPSTQLLQSGAKTLLGTGLPNLPHLPLGPKAGFLRGSVHAPKLPNPPHGHKGANESTTPSITASNTVRGPGLLFASTAVPSQSKSRASASNNSLLGQTYKPPSKEKIAKRGAVKIVSAMPTGEGIDSAISANPAASLASPIVQSCTPPVSEDISHHAKDVKMAKESEDSVHHRVTEENGTKTEKELPVREAKETAKSGVAGTSFISRNSNVTQDQNHKPSQPDVRSMPSTPSSTDHAEELKRFFVNANRRLCLSNLPAATTEADIRELLQKKANTDDKSM